LSRGFIALLISGDNQNRPDMALGDRFCNATKQSFSYIAFSMGGHSNHGNVFRCRNSINFHERNTGGQDCPDGITDKTQLPFQFRESFPVDAIELFQLFFQVGEKEACILNVKQKNEESKIFLFHEGNS